MRDNKRVNATSAVPEEPAAKTRHQARRRNKRYNLNKAFQAITVDTAEDSTAAASRSPVAAAVPEITPALVPATVPARVPTPNADRFRHEQRREQETPDERSARLARERAHQEERRANLSEQEEAEQAYRREYQAMQRDARDDEETRTVAGQHGVYTYRIQGAMGHYLGSLLPRVDPLTNQPKPAKFAQIYIVDPDMQQRAERRRAIFADLDPGTLLDIEQMMTEVNPFAQQFITLSRSKGVFLAGGEAVEVAQRGGDACVAVLPMTSDGATRTVERIFASVNRNYVRLQAGKRNLNAGEILPSGVTTLIEALGGVCSQDTFWTWGVDSAM
ncbi:unnamed protein product [Phytophthora fragariaefolia]|uniref:Unnamed protein product n=1 Tax=Phytophthora fragariaefolia TaxID=1490495 RepID=A0A9W6X5P1_9STRA|nr:unnamed protein product [Phytophthora fragariaefolia]